MGHSKKVKGETIIKVFQKILNESGCKPDNV